MLAKSLKMHRASVDPALSLSGTTSFCLSPETSPTVQIRSVPKTRNGMFPSTIILAAAATPRLLVRSKKNGSRKPVRKGSYECSEHHNHIYIGDHMTRAWTKEGKAVSPAPGGCQTPEVEPRKLNSLNRHKSPTTGYPSRTHSRRKSTTKRRPKSPREILLIFSITKEDLLSWQESFDTLLKNPAGRYVFKSFLESEIADENLKFWLACEDLKKMTKQKRATKMARDIYDTYINVYSPHEVNIDYKMREDIVDQLKNKLDSTVFTQAQHQIYTLMHRDSYPRFLSSQMLSDLTVEVLGRANKGDKSKSEGSLRATELMVCCCCRRQGSVREPARESPPNSPRSDAGIELNHVSENRSHRSSRNGSRRSSSSSSGGGEEAEADIGTLPAGEPANGDTKRPVEQQMSAAGSDRGQTET